MEVGEELVGEWVPEVVSVQAAAVLELALVVVALAPVVVAQRSL